MFVPSGLFQFGVMSVAKPRANPSGEHELPLIQFSAFPAVIRLTVKGLPGTNTLA
jgi:hypothetical protein